MFALASATHGGVFTDTYRHVEASIAEGVIAAVLLAGLAVGLIVPSLARRAGLVSQGIALFGTLIGVSTIIIGIGPQTVPDVIPLRSHRPPRLGIGRVGADGSGVST